MHSLALEMAQRVAAGLQRKTLALPSKWAEKCRVMGSPIPGPWTYKYHPWLREMHDSKAEINVGQKSAQMGFTETVLNLTFYHIDVKNADCLYVLPSKTPDSSDFSSGRFDPALELSPHLKGLFSDVRNIGHKRAGTANLYVRGSKSRGGLKSVPVSFIVLDELDEMNQNNIGLALQRASGQMEWQAWLISTPTLPEVGINKFFLGSTQDHFHFQCEGCSRWTELIFPECMVITAEDPYDSKIEGTYLQCKECKKKLEHQSKYIWLADGKWIPAYTDRTDRGFHISQLYSSAKAARPSNLAKLYLSGLRDPADATEFNNSKLGLTYTAEGAQLTDQDINTHIEGYQNGVVRPDGMMTMGVDVGKFLHVWIDQWRFGQIHGVDANTTSTCRALDIEKVNDFEELDRLMGLWAIVMCVVDANPERRSALQFANRHFGVVKLCDYRQGIHGKDVQISAAEEHLVSVDRTSWLDLSLSRFRRDEMIAIPANFPYEARMHLKTPIRVYKKDKSGNPVGYYDSREKDDHFAHARTYSEIAFKLGAKLTTNRNIPSPV